MKASYNITSDRIVLDPEGVRLAEADYQRLKASRFAFYPGRKIFVVKWNVTAEDLALSLCGEIESDDTPDDVEGRVERFQGYADTAEAASQSASEYSIDATTARRRELAARRAETEAERAEHWNNRIRGAIAQANYREQPGVIARRIKGLEADRRKYEKESKFHGAFLAVWQKSDGLDVDKAKSIANYDGSHLWFELDKGAITADEARAKAVEHHNRILNILARQTVHTKDRLAYEQALLEATGGLPTEGQAWEVGGGVNLRGVWAEITKVNRTTFTAKVQYGGHIKWEKTMAKGLMTKAEYEAYQSGEHTPNE